MASMKTVWCGSGHARNGPEEHIMMVWHVERVENERLMPKIYMSDMEGR